MGVNPHNRTSEKRRHRILVVDDEPIVCASIRMLLTFDGHTVRTAANTEEALRLFDPREIDVLLTDYSMPGAPGTELAATVRKLAPDLPVILVTAYAEMLDFWGADLSHVDCIVSKPFRLEDLRSALDNVVDDPTIS